MIQIKLFYLLERKNGDLVIILNSEVKGKNTATLNSRDSYGQITSVFCNLIGFAEKFLPNPKKEKENVGHRSS